MHAMKFKSQTKVGKYALWLIAGSLFFFMFSNVLTELLVTHAPDGTEGLTPSNGTIIGIPTTIGVLFGVASFFFAFFAVIKRRERSWLIVLPLFFGFFVLLFTIGDIVEIL